MVEVQSPRVRLLPAQLWQHSESTAVAVTVALGFLVLDWPSDVQVIHSPIIFELPLLCSKYSTVRAFPSEKYVLRSPCLPFCIVRTPQYVLSV